MIPVTLKSLPLKKIDLLQTKKTYLYYYFAKLNEGNI